MRIVAATHGDGSNRTFQKLVDSLAHGGHDVHVVGWDRVRKYSRVTSLDGIGHEFILRGGGWRRRWLPLLYPVWMVRLFAYLVAHRSDLVWAANFEVALPAAVSGLLTGVPFIYYIHDNVSLTYRFPWPVSAVMQALDRWTVARAASVIVPDESRIEPQMQSFRGKFVILPNAPRLSAVAEDSPQPPAEPQYDVLALGSLWQSRGIAQLLAAARRVDGIRVLLVGDVPEPATHVTIDAATGVTLRSSVEHAEALELYAHTRSVFAFYDPEVPINVVASPTKLYEAMMMSVAVIVNSETQVSRKVIEWDAGYTCPYADVDALAGILEQIRDRPGECAEKGTHGRSVFVAELAWEKLVPRLYEVIDRVGSRGREAADDAAR